MANKLLKDAMFFESYMDEKKEEEDVVAAWIPSRASTASMEEIQSNPTAWALFARGLTEGHWLHDITMIPQVHTNPLYNNYIVSPVQRIQTIDELRYLSSTQPV